MLKKIAHTLLAVIFLAVAASASAEEIRLFEGGWTGKWVSSDNKNKADSAPMKMLVQLDANTGVVTFLMFQTPEPPAPSFSSMAIGKLNGGKVIIDAASSGIDGGGTEMTFWLEGLMMLVGTYKNQYDEGRFEFRRFSGNGA